MNTEESHVMLDIETLGTRSTSVIIQVAAVYFEPKTGLVSENVRRVQGADKVRLLCVILIYRNSIVHHSR
jgi:hypothetical protein